MRIFFSENHDPIVQDSVDGLQKIYEEIKRFLESEDLELRIEAKTHGIPTPFDRFLPALVFGKTNGLNRAFCASESGLRIEGKPTLLATHVRAFNICKNQDHQHADLFFSPDEKVFETDSLYPYVQADNEYESESYWKSA